MNELEHARLDGQNRPAIIGKLLLVGCMLLLFFFLSKHLLLCMRSCRRSNGRYFWMKTNRETKEKKCIFSIRMKRCTTYYSKEGSLSPTEKKTLKIDLFLGERGFGCCRFTNITFIPPSFFFKQLRFDLMPFPRKILDDSLSSWHLRQWIRVYLSKYSMLESVFFG